jgi:pimeloyl-ACP methyl ester carboxylesterase
LGKPRLTGPCRFNKYNLIAFDQFSCGYTQTKPDPRHDTWVEAAATALALEKLSLPPCHVFANQNAAVNIALRLAMLWPEKCLSLALAGIPADQEYVS